MKNVAVVGAGISGLAVAYLLSRKHRVHVFEKERRLGGHTHTVTVDTADGPLSLDTGFLVHNDRTYPNLVRLFDELGIATRNSDMSFGVTCRQSGLEYSSRGFAGFFARRANLWNLSHFRLLGEIVRFHREAPALLSRDGAAALTLDDFLQEKRFGDQFVEQYLLPMASAIWSASCDAVRSFPALTLVRFLDNHGLLRLTGQPTWKVVANGSSSYIPRLIAPLGDRVHSGVAIDRVSRAEDHVTIDFTDRPSGRFDEVVFACHGDQVLPLLAEPTLRERDIFSRFTTTTNTVCLHTDASVLPKRAAARAAWNYLLTGDGNAAPSVSYDLNRLQGLTTRERYCLTLNPNVRIDEDRVLRRLVYRHPLYTHDAIRAQALWADVSGANRTHFCGAYWGYGFHEDGLNSALRVARRLGVEW